MCAANNQKEGRRISTESVPITQDELEEFYRLLEDIDVGLEHFKTQLGTLDVHADTVTGYGRNEDGHLFGWIEYIYAQDLNEDNREVNRHEVYVPGTLENGEFMPVIWSDKQSDIVGRLKSNHGIETSVQVKFSPGNHYYPGIETRPAYTAGDEVFRQAVLDDEDIELEPVHDEELGCMAEPELKSVKAGNIHYGVVEYHPETVDSEVKPRAEVLGELQPYGEIQPIDDRTQLSVLNRVKYALKADNIEFR